MKRILITGANRSLGLSIAHKLTSPDVFLILTGRELSALQKSHGGMSNRILRQLDFASPISSREFEDIGSIDAVIHCASPYTVNSLFEAEDQELTQYGQFITNNLIFIKQVSKHFSSVGGRIVLIGSTAGDERFMKNSHTAYRFYKSSLKELARISADELAPRRIGVTYLNLGSFLEHPPENLSNQLSESSVVDKVVEIIKSPVWMRMDRVDCYPFTV